MSSVDVIVPCYRYGRYLRECVHSALSQEGVEVRVMIIDDASPDDTPVVAAELAAGDSRVSYVRHDVNKRHIATYNEGLDWASADYLILLSADDYLTPRALARATAVLDSRPDTVLAFGRSVELHPGGELRDIHYALADLTAGGPAVVDGSEFIRMSGPYNVVPTPTVVVRTEVQKRVGGYDPELPHTADMEMWWRLATCGAVVALDDVQAVYRRHSDNMSLDYAGAHMLEDLRQRAAAIERFFSLGGRSMPNGSVVRSEAMRLLALEALTAASSAHIRGSLSDRDALLQLAQSIEPAITRTRHWMKLRVKRLLGSQLTAFFAKARRGDPHRA